MKKIGIAIFGAALLALAAGPSSADTIIVFPTAGDDRTDGLLGNVLLSTPAVSVPSGGAAPEPAGLALLGATLLALSFIRRKKK